MQCVRDGLFGDLLFPGQGQDNVSALGSSGQWDSWKSSEGYRRLSHSFNGKSLGRGKSVRRSCVIKGTDANGTLQLAPHVLPFTPTGGSVFGEVLLRPRCVFECKHLI